MEQISNEALSGRLDPTKYWNQPVGQPLYPELPWHCRDSDHVLITYETDLDPVLDILPLGVSVAHNPPRVVASVGRYAFCSGGGGYVECAYVVPVEYKGKAYSYAPVVYLGDGSEEWFAAGREVWGHAKKIARISFDRDPGRGVIRASVSRPAEHLLAEMSVGPLVARGNDQKFAHPDILSVRVIPSPSGPEPETVQLVATKIDAQLEKDGRGRGEFWVGPGNIRIFESALDPWCRLPVRRIIAGGFLRMNVDTGYAEVLETYV